MTLLRTVFLLGMMVGIFVCASVLAADALPAEQETTSFPRALDDYGDSEIDAVAGKLRHRIQVEPFNIVATLIFFLAIVHTFLSSKLLAVSHKWEMSYAERLVRDEVPPGSVHHGARALHFLGEIETVFGIWAIALLGNGCAGAIIDLLEAHLPFQFIKVHHEPDGTFPHGVPNPLLPEKRAETGRAVRENQADLGIAWDGDFDRCFFWDENGKFIEGYYIVGLLAREMLKKEPGARRTTYQPGSRRSGRATSVAIHCA